MNSTLRHHGLLLFVLIMFATTGHGQGTPDILDYGNGQITWTNADPSLHYTIEWKASLTDSNWLGSYRGLQDLQPSSSTVTTAVPMFLRVVGYSNAVYTSTLSPDTADVPQGYFSATNLTQVEIDLVASNIRAGVVLFGITGTLNPGSNSPPLLTIDMVTVGDPGNTDDSSTNGLVGDIYSGAVSNTYKIGKYEVSNREYTTFLNAVDPTGSNSLSLYNPSMATDVTFGGITNNDAAALGSKYEVKAGFGDKPVVFVSFYDAMRFCNWLHNGALAGGNTEDGAYSLGGGGPTPTNGTTVVRNPGAQFAVPTEDEWYKAAYYDPVSAGADLNGNTNYWLYPTQSDTKPTAESPPGSAPAANYDQIGGGVLYAVGQYTNTTSYYGAFDMAGNVFEVTERVAVKPVAGNPLGRVYRGGSWKTKPPFLSPPVFPLESTWPQIFVPSDEKDHLGFRISASP